jgi:hypothetical protein
MIIPHRPVLLIATTMSAIMLVGSSSPSMVPATAFAQRDGFTDDLLGQLLNLDSKNLDSNNENSIAENEVDHYSVIVDPTIQISVDAAVKFTDGNDVALLGGCADINDDDKVTQVSEQAANQVVHKNNDLEDGVLAVDPTIQQISVQTAANVNTDNDVYIVLGCHDGNVKISDNDKVTQVSEQAANQEALTDSDGPTIQQTSVQTAANVNTDNDVYIVLGCHDGNVKISDNDKVTQVSEQAANQEALTDSDGPTIQQTSVQTAANHNEDNDRTVYIGSLNL